MFSEMISKQKSDGDAEQNVMFMCGGLCSYPADDVMEKKTEDILAWTRGAEIPSELKNTICGLRPREFCIFQ